MQDLGVIEFRHVGLKSQSGLVHDQFKQVPEFGSVI